MSDDIQTPVRLAQEGFSSVAKWVSLNNKRVKESEQISRRFGAGPSIFLPLRGGILLVCQGVNIKKLTKRIN
jgi:hypothetical protein